MYFKISILRENFSYRSIYIWVCIFLSILLLFLVVNVHLRFCLMKFGQYFEHYLMNILSIVQYGGLILRVSKVFETSWINNKLKPRSLVIKFIKLHEMESVYAQKLLFFFHYKNCFRDVFLSNETSNKDHTSYIYICDCSHLDNWEKFFQTNNSIVEYLLIWK